MSALVCLMNSNLAWPGAAGHAAAAAESVQQVASSLPYKSLWQANLVCARKQTKNKITENFS